MDLLSMEDQLRLITQTDVLIGMHGAGLAHALMLQKHAAMVELIPSYYGSENNHFADLARWSGISYLKWINMDFRSERPNFQTVVPLAVINDIIERAVKHICSDKTNGQNADPLYVINGIQQQMTRRSMSKLPVAQRPSPAPRVQVQVGLKPPPLPPPPRVQGQGRVDSVVKPSQLSSGMNLVKPSRS